MREYGSVKTRILAYFMQYIKTIIFKRKETHLDRIVIVLPMGGASSINKKRTYVEPALLYCRKNNMFIKINNEQAFLKISRAQKLM